MLDTDGLAGGGRGGIRTHGTLAGTPVFKTGALNHSATLPLPRHQSLSIHEVKNGRRTKPGLAPTWPQSPSGLPLADCITSLGVSDFRSALARSEGPKSRSP